MENTCPLFKWENQDLFVDNKNVARKNFQLLGDLFVPHLAFNAHLAQKMGWFTKKDNGEFVIGPNLLMVFPDGKVPATNAADWLSPAKTPLYYKSHTDNNQVT